VPVSHCAPELLHVLLSRADKVGTASLPATNARREMRRTEGATNIFVPLVQMNDKVG